MIHIRNCKNVYICIVFGEMPEWSNGAVSKTVVLFMGTKGSNPFLSAKKNL